MCRVPALNKLRLAMMAMMAMITMTMKMITNNEIKENSAQRRQPCCGGGGGENDGCWYARSFAREKAMRGGPSLNKTRGMMLLGNKVRA
jgi:hypothetical protein